MICTILLAATLHAQFHVPNAPNIQWQRCLGGSGEDIVDDNPPPLYMSRQKPLISTDDGGYLLGGTVRSNDGDVNNNHGANDIWLVRLDRLGNTVWKKTFGGSGNEFIGGIQETSDHGFIVVGSSNSNNGDVSGNHGDYDAWVFRIDSRGDLLWQKSFGGSRTDRAHHVVIGSDNGIAVVGSTKSYNGDVSGLHSISGDSTATDTWVFKLDETGALQWQKCLGGNNIDEGVSIDITGDGGFIVGSNSWSYDGDVTGNRGIFDIWVVKLNSIGSIVWQRCYGGRNSEYIGRIRKTADNGFIIAGFTESIDGDVTPQPENMLFPKTDGWILKINANGVPIWNKCYGSPYRGDEKIYDIIELASGDFIASGYVLTPELSTYKNSMDAWLFQVTATGSIVWMNAYGSIGREHGRAVAKSTDDGFLMLGTTDLDAEHNYPAYPTHVRGSHGAATDLWVVKFGRINKVTGTVFFDKNKNGTKDGEEPLLSDVRVRSVKGQVGVENVTKEGTYINEVDTGSFVTSVVVSNYFDIFPVSIVSTFTEYNLTDTIHFAVQPKTGKRDLFISALPLDVARPGFAVVYRIFYRNNGTDTVPEGEIRFIKDPRLSFVSSSPVHSAINGDTIKWIYNDLKPLDTASIQVRLRVAQPPTVNLNDTLSSMAIITPVTGDLTPSDDTAYLNQIVIGSYDPNDKSENLAGEISLREVSSSSYINYLIRFQNTGTDTAFNVTIRDTLDDKLDWSSLQMVAASHFYQLNIKSQNQLTWNFSNILLVDSNRNEPASHGYIAYRVKPKNNLVIGDIIRNRASIYFDFNLPVETNIQETEVVMYSISNPQASAPTITSFTPTSAATGAAITITGTNFTGATAVSFGGTAATSFIVNSSTSITATIGAGASGNVSITTPGGTASLAGFTFIPAPIITSFTPTSGGTGASITIAGTDFTGATAVSFGGTAATSFSVNSATSITAVVGTGATGSVSVTTPGGTVTLAGFTYTVVTAIDPVPGNSLGIRLYPNPVTNGSFIIDTLKLNDQWEVLEIFDADGKKKLSSFTVRNKTIVTIQIEHLAKGFYTAILRRKSGQSAVIKFLKL